MRRVIVITGNGKGKTTSAIGCAVRAAGRGVKVAFYQFVKSGKDASGENLFFRSARKLKIQSLGLGGRMDFKYTDRDIKAARAGLQRVRREIKKYGMVVLDEVSYPINWGWFDVKDIEELISSSPSVHFVLTGRDMPVRLTAMADTVSNIEDLMHIYRNGVEAQKGIEY